MPSLESHEIRLNDLERKDRLRALNDLRAQLRADGYDGSCHNSETARAVTRESCELCGNQTLRYLGGVVRLSPLSQIEFIQCKTCGWWTDEA